MNRGASSRSIWVLINDSEFGCIFIVRNLVEESGDSAASRVLLKSDLENLDYSLFGSWPCSYFEFGVSFYTISNFQNPVASFSSFLS